MVAINVNKSKAGILYLNCTMFAAQPPHKEIAVI